MAKKIIGLIFVLVVVFAIFITDANAAYEINEDFSSGDLNALYNMNSPDGEGWSRTVEDSALHLVNPANGAMSQYIMAQSASSDGNVVVLFDLKWESDEGYLIVNMYLGNGTRHAISMYKDLVYTSGASAPHAKHTTGVWYTYLCDMSPETMDLYRRERDSDEPFKKLYTSNVQMNQSGSLMLQPYCAQGFDGYLDNIKMYTSTFAVDGSFVLDESEINDIDDIKGGNLKASATVASTFGANEEVDGETILTSVSATPLLVIYNKNHKMIYSKVVDDGALMLGENNIEVTVDINEFAGKLKGGYIGFYLWDSLGSLQPLMDAVELN